MTTSPAEPGRRTPSRLASGTSGRVDPLVAVVGVVALAVYWVHGFDGLLSRDLAVYTYGGQQVVDGVPPYVGVLNRAGPLAHLLPAVGIGAARLLGADDLHGARVLYLLLSVVSVCLAYVVGRDLLRSKLGGLATASALLCFGGFIEYASDGPREKTPMVLFMLCALWAMSRRQWFLCGLFLSLATLVLQIGFFVVAPAVLVMLLASPGSVSRGRAVVQVVVGGLVPVGVFLLYFAIEGAVGDFVDAFLVVNARYTSPNPITDDIPGRWALLEQGFGVSLWVLLLGLAATVLLMLVALVPAARRRSPTLVPVAALGVATLAGLYWTMRDFDSWPDAFPLLPMAALGVGALVVTATARLSRQNALTATLAWTVLAVALSFGFSATHRHDELVVQRRSVAAVLARLPANATVMTVNAPQPLVLSGRRNPTRYLMFPNGLGDYIGTVWPGGLTGFGDAMVRRRPDVVAVGSPPARFVSQTIAKKYVSIGTAPDWKWLARRSLGPAKLAALREAVRQAGNAGT